jgi:acyl-coenzyme A thioesterase PaaI-like protein
VDAGRVHVQPDRDDPWRAALHAPGLRRRGRRAHTQLAVGVGYGSIEIKVSYLKALRADSGDIDVHGRALQVGRRVAFAEAHARNAAGELVGHATSSIAVIGA